MRVRRHPRTGKLVLPIGLWRSRRGWRLVWPVMGASEPAPEPPAPAPAPPLPAPTPPAPTPGPTPSPPAPTPEPEPDDKTDWKTEARKWEQRAKENVEKAKRLDELEAANQTELEKATKTAQEAEERARAATLRAVKSEVKSLASKFVDPEDAVLRIGELARFVGDDGEIDGKAIKAELDEVLKKNTHLAKAEPKPQPTPGRPVPTLRPGAAPDEPARAANLTDAINARLGST